MYDPPYPVVTDVESPGFAENKEFWKKWFVIYVFEHDVSFCMCVFICGSA